VIAALRPIRTGGEAVFGSIGDGGHRNKRQDDNPKDKQPKPVPKAWGLGHVRFMTEIDGHGVDWASWIDFSPAGMAQCPSTRCHRGVNEKPAKE
jgi:hypothetical protein